MKARLWTAIWLVSALAGSFGPGASSARADEIRESYDADGRLTRRMVLKEDRLLEESTLEYDAQGRPFRKKTVKDGKVTVESTTYYGTGKVSRSETWTEGKLADRKSYLYTGGRLTSMTQESETQSPVTTSYQYDLNGNMVASQTTDANGVVTGRTLADYARPSVPIHLGLDAGGSYLSDSGVADFSLGFVMSRKPIVERFGSDPLEVAVAGSARFTSQRGKAVNSYLTAHFGVDYNFLFPRTTIFLFATVERNVPANLSVNLEAAPAGVKFDLVKRNPFLVDFSFAPVWNFRAITTPVDEAGNCEGVAAPEGATLCDETSTSRLRGSFRFRVGYGAGGYRVGNTIEFLPDLHPEGGFFASLSSTSILRDTTSIEIKLTNRVAFKYELKLIRDPQLAGQNVCPSDDTPLLCQGLALQTSGVFSFKFDVRR